MTDRILVFYGSYRTDRAGIRLANYTVSALQARGNDVELIDAHAVDLPILDRKYTEYAPGTAPDRLEALARKIVAAAPFLFVNGEYNWGRQPGLKQLNAHFHEAWCWRPAANLTQYAGPTAD